MKNYILFLSLMCFLGCNSSAPSEEEQAPAKETGIKSEASREEPVPFPVYLTFDEFEPHLQKQNDTTYVINFWATWCKPCVAELPYFERLIRETNGQPVKVILVSMDFPKQIKSKLIPFVKERNLTPHVVALADMDYNSWIDKVSTEWDGAIPFSLIYRGGKREIMLGELDSYEELTEVVEKVL